MEQNSTDQLGSIGFYTLSDQRAKTASEHTRLVRCELLLTGRCNFHCEYCRGVGGKDIPFEKACELLDLWCKDNLYAVRFSGGEPTLYRRLPELVQYARAGGIQKIAVSTNGSAPWSKYEKLLKAGVNDWSVSLDACCACLLYTSPSPRD